MLLAARGQHRPQGASSRRGVRGEDCGQAQGCGGTDRAAVGPTFKQHPGDAGEGVLISRSSDHGPGSGRQKLTVQPRCPRKAKRWCTARRASRKVRKSALDMRARFSEEEEAGGRGDVEPAPVLLRRRRPGARGPAAAPTAPPRCPGC